MGIAYKFAKKNRVDKSEVSGETVKSKWFEIEWVDGFEIRVKADHDAVVIAANKEGMLSLAKQLTALAEAAPGQHIHYDEYNSLEEGSSEMIIVKEK